MEPFNSHSRYSMPVDRRSWSYNERSWLGSYPEQSLSDENQGWNTNRDARWRESSREEYVLLYDSQAQKEQSFDLESCHTREMLSKILTKVEGSDMVLHDLKVHLTSLNLTVASHTSSIEHLKFQMGALTAQFNQVKAMDVSTQSLAVLTRSGKTIYNGNQATCVDLETQKQGIRVENEKMAKQVQATPVNANEP